MHPRQAALCLLACQLALGTSKPLSPGWQTLPDGKGLQTVLLPGAPKWQLLPDLFLDKEVAVSCHDGKVRTNPCAILSRVLQPAFLCELACLSVRADLAD